MEAKFLASVFSFLSIFLAIYAQALVNDNEDSTEFELETAIYYGDSNVNLAEPFSITCIIPITDPILWLKDDEPITRHNLRHGRDEHAYILSESAIEGEKHKIEAHLSVRHALKVHEGKYQCNNLHTSYHMLHVRSPPILAAAPPPPSPAKTQTKSPFIISSTNNNDNHYSTETAYETYYDLTPSSSADDIFTRTWEAGGGAAGSGRGTSKMPISKQTAAGSTTTTTIASTSTHHRQHHHHHQQQQQQQQKKLKESHDEQQRFIYINATNFDGNPSSTFYSSGGGGADGDIIGAGGSSSDSSSSNENIGLIHLEYVPPGAAPPPKYQNKSSELATPPWRSTSTTTMTLGSGADGGGGIRYYSSSSPPQYPPPRTTIQQQSSQQQHSTTTLLPTEQYFAPNKHHTVTDHRYHNGGGVIDTGNNMTIDNGVIPIGGGVGGGRRHHDREQMLQPRFPTLQTMQPIYMTPQTPSSPNMQTTFQQQQYGGGIYPVTHTPHLNPFSQQPGQQQQQQYNQMLTYPPHQQQQYVPSVITTSSPSATLSPMSTAATTTTTTTPSHLQPSKSKEPDFLVPNYDNAEHQLKVYEIRSPLVLSCDITKEGAYELKWEKNGTDVTKVKELQGRYRIIAPERKFIIDRTDIHDDGAYSCVVDGQKKLINVVARVVVRVPSNSGVVEGEKLSIVCTVVGTDPQLTWAIGNLTISNSTGRYILKPDDNRVQNAILSVENVSLDDRGEFKCIGRNAANEYAGYSEASDVSFVRVKGKLAALWPFLGICAEVLILCTIILIYEKRRNKSELEESDTDPQEQKKKRRNYN